MNLQYSTYGMTSVATKVNVISYFAIVHMSKRLAMSRRQIPPRKLWYYYKKSFNSSTTRNIRYTRSSSYGSDNEGQATTLQKIWVYMDTSTYGYFDGSCTIIFKKSIF